MIYPQMLLDLHGELIVDLFAGGGGASVGIEMALGRTVDVAVNHDAAAVAMHRVNHPQTDHHVCDVFEVDPRTVTQGRPVGLLWASPDCTFHSKARGGKPIRSKERKRRALAWVVTRWAGQVRPRVIMLENVEEFAEWGPLVGPPTALRPCRRRAGRTFRRWVRSLEAFGYQVEWRELRACDYGAPTIRKRLFVIARCDGRPIVWPKPTHGPGRKHPYRTAAECIDWSIPMLSIFATKEEAKAWGRKHRRRAPKRPLAGATERRIARGVVRYVVENPRPFVVGVGARRGQSPERDLREPMHTVVGKNDAAVVAPVISQLAHGDGAGRTARWGLGASEYGAPLPTIHAGGNSHALVAPYLVPRYGERPGQEPRVRSVEDPAPVVVPTGNGASLAAAFLAKHFGDRGQRPGSELVEPVSTVTASDHNALVAAHLSHFYTSNTRGGEGNPALPLKTHTTANHAAVVYSFLQKYYGQGIGQDLASPAPTVTTKDRIGVVTVMVAGEPYVLVDIAMRMLQPRELYRAQGFPDSYVIDRGADGRRLTQEEQVRMCGNSVCPPMAAALARANVPELVVRDDARRTA